MKKKRKGFPPIPSQMYSALGLIPVTRRKAKGKDGIIRGELDLHDRTVWVAERMNKAIEWQTYFHEMTHVILFDSGLHNQLSSEAEESLCDAIGNYFAQAVKHGFISVPRARGKVPIK